MPSKLIYHRNKPPAGYTLIELITVIGIISVMVLFLYRGYLQQMTNQRVIASVDNAQLLVNAAAIERFKVENPDDVNYEFTYPVENRDSYSSINGLAVELQSKVHGTRYAGEVYESLYQFERQDELLRLRVSLPGTNWSFPRADKELYSTDGEGAENASYIYVFPRTTKPSPVDLTAISRRVKQQYYWQTIR